jgi:hypothetical protein
MLDGGHPGCGVGAVSHVHNIMKEEMIKKRRGLLEGEFTPIDGWGSPCLRGGATSYSFASKKPTSTP